MQERCYPVASIYCASGGIVMRKLRAALCLSCLMLLIPALMQAHRILPLDTRPLVSEKYAGWSGVLSLWIFEGWPCGNGSILEIEQVFAQTHGMYFGNTYSYYLFAASHMLLTSFAR